MLFDFTPEQVAIQNEAKLYATETLSGDAQAREDNHDIGPEIIKFLRSYRTMIMHKSCQARLKFHEIFGVAVIGSGGTRWWVSWEQLVLV